MAVKSMFTPASNVRSTELIAARVVSATLMAVTLSSCGELPAGPAQAARMDVKGVTLAEWSAEGYLDPRAMQAVVDIAETGANSLTLVVTAYQTDVSSNVVMIDDRLTPTEESVAAIMLKAGSVSPAALSVTIKPHVDLYGGGWRGTIHPSDPDAWFESYRTFIMPYVILGESLGAKQFVVGTELAGTLDFEGHWRRLIEEIAQSFSGQLLYAASWDEAPLVPFWDVLDRVGVDFYAPVSARDDPHRMDLLVGWQPWLDRLRLLHKLAGRNVVLTEIGYRSVDGAGRHPYEFTSGAPVDLQEQADLYWAALEALGDKPWIDGVYWWNWLATGNPAEELRDFTPKGKPAQVELTDGWQ